MSGKDDRQPGMFQRGIAASLVKTVQDSLVHPPVRLVPPYHGRWPLPSNTSGSSSRPLRISVLDSSFNPPTRAHLSLIQSQFPNRDAGDYDAKLLLLSVRNPDKTIKSTDASYVQRLEMMHLLAKEVGEEANVAVAIIDAPIFAEKGTILTTFLKKRLSELLSSSDGESSTDCQLSFLLGFDTLERLVSPKYYAPPSKTANSPEAVERMLSSLRKFLSPPPDGDDCTIVCARRDPSSYPALAAEVDGRSPIVAYAEEFIHSKRIMLIDIGEVEQSFSSSNTRSMVSSGSSKTWQEHVPRSIEDFIQGEGLYTTS